MTARLILFTLRHLIGLVVFAWLTKIARETDPQSNLWMIVAALFVFYLIAVVVGGRHLFAAMRRARRHSVR
jgi:Kef-type K+ transport system membrane component KefB